MNCDQCVAAMINGVFCHETGCPNIKKEIECFVCGYPVTDEDNHEECLI